MDLKGGRGSQHKAEGDGPARGAAKGRAALGRPQAGQAAAVMQGAPQGQPVTACERGHN